jgi:dATP/dGTP diphosphohydrolase
MGNEDTTNPKDRLGLKKTRLSLVPASSIIYQALAMEDGARKYGPYNWREKKVIASIYIDAAMRHLQAWFDGENEASDSQKPHLGHALACIGIIIDALETGNLVDDRPKPGAAARLIAKFERKDAVPTSNGASAAATAAPASP